MAEAIVSITIGSLWGLLREEEKILSGVSDQVDELCEKFRRLQCFLQDADARQHKEQSVRNWIWKIRRLAYRAEDIIESYAVEVSSRTGKGFKKACKRFACIVAEVISLHKISSEIGNIKTEIARLTTSLEAHGIKAISSQGESSSSRAARDEKERWLRKTYLHEDEDLFVGRKNDIEKLLYFLLKEDGSDQIVSILGMGGSGKTTVARKIYTDAQIRRHFDAFAWVFISPQCQVRKVLEEILHQIFVDHAKMKREVKEMADGELVEELYKQQKEKKCLVVLDDIWNVDDWNCLKPVFPSTVSCSKILLTTRETEVAKIGRIHMLNCMNEDDALELLQKKALILDRTNVRDLKNEAEKEKIGRELVRKCGYLPLAILVLGGVLRRKESVDEWRVVNEELRQEEGNTSTSTEGVMQILSLSYDDLPHHLKLCLLSFGLFSGYDAISMDTLFSLWLAYGIVLSKNPGRGENTLEEAIEYVSELASRSMVEAQASRYIPTGLGYSSCKLHNLMRDLAKCRAEDFVKVVDLQGGKELPIFPTSTDDTKAHRLVIHTNYKYIDCKKFSAIGNIAEEVRYLVASNRDPARAEITFSPEIQVNKFKCLRFLYIWGYDFRDKELMQVIEKLIHLRSLIFKNCCVDELPLGILNLPYLQTVLLDMDFRGLSKIQNPNIGWKAKRLRRLSFPNSSENLVVGGNLRLCGLLQLEGLFYFRTDTMAAKDLCDLRNLREFSAIISGNDNLCLILRCIDIHWPHIHNVLLTINSCEFITTKNEDLLSKLLSCRPICSLKIVGSLGNKLPEYKRGLGSSLIQLELDQSKIREDPMKTLEKFPNLKELYLLEDTFVGNKMVCHKMGFPSLEVLVLRGLQNLEEWRVDQGAMPNLRSLEILDCGMLEEIPNGLKFISALREIKIVGMPEEFNDQIRTVDGRKGPDYDIVRHVPSITIL